MHHWKKLGLVWKPDGQQQWAKSHAMIPTPIILNEDIIRVYVSCLDANGIARPTFVDVKANEPTSVVYVNDDFLFDIGSPGSFDDNGIVVTSVVKNDSIDFIYYAGFELCTKVRYRLFTGLAICKNTYSKFSRKAILDRTNNEYMFRCGSYCFHDSGMFKLWYIGGSDWVDIDGKPMPVYDLRYLESKDGIHWPDEGQVVMKITNDDEHGFGRPWVVKKSDTDYRLYYSIRRKSLKAYRLGYATSTDGIHWVRRDDEMNLDVSTSGFDSEAIMYSAVITVKDKTYCFYNGNNFGVDGFAVAELED